MAAGSRRQTGKALAKAAHKTNACIGWGKQVGEGETVTQSMWAALLVALLILAASYVTAQAAVLFESNRQKKAKKEPPNGGPKKED